MSIDFVCLYLLISRKFSLNHFRIWSEKSKIHFIHSKRMFESREFILDRNRFKKKFHRNQFQKYGIQHRNQFISYFLSIFSTQNHQIFVRNEMNYLKTVRQPFWMWTSITIESEPIEPIQLWSCQNNRCREAADISNFDIWNFYHQLIIRIVRIRVFHSVKQHFDNLSRKKQFDSLIFLCGSEWVSFKIHCDQLRAHFYRTICCAVGIAKSVFGVGKQLQTQHTKMVASASK